MKQFNKTSAIRKIKFQKNKNTYIKRLSISLSCLILLFLVILFTFARFENSSDEYVLINGQVKNVCEYELGHEWTFDYTGSEQEFNVPCNGEYKLEVWGASGGYAYDSTRSTGGGGYGGVSEGNINLDIDDKVYINVGGSGESNCQTKSCLGGYNGGSQSAKWASADGKGLYTGGGGGATHIALITGLLSTLENYKNEILIVAGGGGGGDYYPSWNTTASGGSGGGVTGGGSYKGDNASFNSSDANQTSGYQFGTAGTTYTSDSTGGSGGGWYGATSNRQHATGAGGSGYIGNSNLTNKKMVCYNCTTSNDVNTKTLSNTCHSTNPTAACAKEGNGYAKITLLSTTDYAKVSCDNLIGKTWTFDYTGDVQTFNSPCNGTYKLETWGAQGGSTTNSDKPGNTLKGGFGGYSTGNISINNSETIYLFIGQFGQTVGMDDDVITVSAYPNGGAVSSMASTTYDVKFNTGGGSTHISKKNQLIEEINPSSNDLLIVAGGGGGVANWWSNSGDNGGSGGGYVGGSTTINFSGINSTGGSQSEPGLGGGNSNGHNREGEWLAGKYGKGGGSETYNPPADSVSGGGGGGYYGGGASWGGSGAGGSGYIGNSNLTSKHMTCYNCTTSNDANTKTISNTCHSTNPTADCAKEGNGYAKITYISK